MLKMLYSKNIFRGLAAAKRSYLRPELNPRLHARQYSSDLYEPDYLEVGKSLIPSYDLLNIQIKGYDYSILESYQKYIHSMMGCLGVDVEDCWATPPKHFHIQKYKPQTTVIDGDYKLSMYERNVQVADVPSTVYPVMLSVLRLSLPQGVSLSVHEHQPEQEEIRYVPDLELKDLKNQLEDMGGPSKQKK